MSEDETFVLVGCLILTGILWIPWTRRIVSVSPMCSPLAVRMPALLSPLLGAVTLGAILHLYADDEVGNSLPYMSLYMLMGGAWVGLAARAVRWFGLSVRDDVAERSNAAASWAIAGAILGLTLAFAGANIGEGPGWWVVVFCALLSTGALFLLWYLLAKFTNAHDAITIDRDLAAGLRVAAFFVAAGAVLGRCVAGDWVSTWATVVDFGATAWRVLPIAAVAGVFEWGMRPTALSPRRSVLVCGLVPAACYLIMAYVAINVLGAW